MDDSNPILAPEPRKPIQDRAREIWKDRLGKGFRTSGKQLSALLIAEGYTRAVAPQTVRNWIALWMDEDGLLADDTNNPFGTVAQAVEIVAASRKSITEANIQAIHNGMLVLLDAAKSLGSALSKALVDMPLKSPAELQTLVTLMTQLSDAAERMSRATDYIEGRKIAARSEDGREIDGQIIEPEETYIPPHVRASMREFERQSAGQK